MSTNVALGFALTPSYLAKVSFWKRPARDQVHLMLDSIKTAFKARVNQLQWIEDKHVKKAIIDKINGVEAVIGYPEFAADTRQLDQMYKALDISPDDFLGNIVGPHVTRKATLHVQNGTNLKVDFF